jgi:DNA-binding transcriptional LysR family regulator
MDSPDIGWDLQRSFLGVLRNGSLSAAARALGLTQPTLGRHIDTLEAALGVKLFARSRHGLVPLQAALDLKPHAETMEAAAESFVRAASGEANELRGAVRLTASNIIGAEVLPPILRDFRERNPQIAIELVLSNRNQDLSRRDADIAIRMVRPTQKALVARRLGMVKIRFYAHRDYLARHGAPRNIGDLAGHAVIGFDRDAASVRWLGANLPVTRNLFALRTDDDQAQLNALRAGFGIGGCQSGIAANDPNLVVVLPGALGFSLEMWLVMHEDLRLSRRVRLLFDHLATALKSYAAKG